MKIADIFYSIQGEGRLAGVPSAFVRTTGCNLRCTYCDSAYAFKGGRKLSIPQILETIRPYQVRHVLLTGGEPLLQRGVQHLVQALRQLYIGVHRKAPVAYQFQGLPL